MLAGLIKDEFNVRAALCPIFDRAMTYVHVPFELIQRQNKILGLRGAVRIECT